MSSSYSRLTKDLPDDPQPESIKRWSTISAGVSVGVFLVMTILALVASSTLDQYRASSTAAGASSTAFDNPRTVAKAIAGSFLAVTIISTVVFVRNGWAKKEMKSWWLVVIGVIYVVLAALWIEGWVLAFHTADANVVQACAVLSTGICLTSFYLLRWLSPMLEGFATAFLIWQFYMSVKRYNFNKKQNLPTKDEDAEANIGLLSTKKDDRPSQPSSISAPTSSTSAPIFHFYMGGSSPASIDTFKPASTYPPTPLYDDNSVGKRKSPRHSQSSRAEIVEHSGRKKAKKRKSESPERGRSESRGRKRSKSRSRSPSRHSHSSKTSKHKHPPKSKTGTKKGRHHSGSDTDSESRSRSRSPSPSSKSKPNRGRGRKRRSDESDTVAEDKKAERAAQKKVDEDNKKAKDLKKRAQKAADNAKADREKLKKAKDKLASDSGSDD